MQFQKPQNPWEGSFENLTVSAAKPVKKAVTEAVKVTADDIKKQLFGEKPLEEITEQESRRVEEQEKKKLVETARRMKEIDGAIKRAREERLKRERESRRVEEQEKKQKKTEEQKKKEPIWQKAMKMGLQSERRVNAGG